MSDEPGRIIPLSGAATPFKGRRAHFIGIGGCGMRGLAALLLREGAVVSGSDMVSSPATDYLAGLGAVIAVGHADGNIPAEVDRVIISAAIKEENPEVAAARRRNIPVGKYADLLGEVMRSRCGVAVAGTHGKSTTTALVSYMLMLAGLDPSFVVGGEVPQLGGGSRAGGGRHFVAEACEFDRSFLKLHPRIAAILNVDYDHPDCYPDLNSVIEAFAAFASLPPADGMLIAGGQDRNMPDLAGRVSAPVETFGLGDGPFDWQARGLHSFRGQYQFDVVYHGRCLGSGRLKMAGRHNVKNALAAAAMAHHAGAHIDAILRAMATFGGVARRTELKGISRGIAVVDDYAHHPTEIQASLRSIAEAYEPQRLWVVFQPHQHSRTRFLMSEFAHSFARANVVLVPDIYFVRDSEAEKQAVSSADLVSEIQRAGGEAEYLDSFDRIVARLAAELVPGDCLVTMGAGSVYEIADRILERLSEAAGTAGR